MLGQVKENLKKHKMPINKTPSMLIQLFKKDFSKS